MLATIYLNKAKEGAIRRGHPWVFPKAIKHSSGTLTNGELVRVMSEQGEFLGVGVYNDYSLYRVRILAYAFETIALDAILSIVRHRLQQALLVRLALLLPSKNTNAYRLFNSEGDGLSGLTIDKFNQVCVVASSAYWVEKHKDAIIAIIKEIFIVADVIWMPQLAPLKQDGWTDSVKASYSLVTEVLEGGVRYKIDFAGAQKTGLFLDQRENHCLLAKLARGKRVLDLYTYTGGFALHAALGGAITVTAVDSSASAIAVAAQNAVLNGLSNIEFIAADARDYLVHAQDYDLVILDPPKLVPSQRHLQQAKNYYRYLHREVFKSMRSGSLLMTCNCSSAMEEREFTALIHAQAIAVGKMVRVMGVYGPAKCHPYLPAFPEGHYLTAVLLAVL